MDDRLIQPFLQSLSEVFSTILAAHPEPGMPVDLSEQESSITDVSGTVMFTGDMEGGITVGFPLETARAVATAFLGMEVTTDDPAFASVIGEIANMVAGVGKGQFEGIDLSISLPSVCVGREHTIVPPSRVSRVNVPFTSQHGNLFIEIGWALDPSRSVVESRHMADATASGDSRK